MNILLYYLLVFLARALIRDRPSRLARCDIIKRKMGKLVERESSYTDETSIGGIMSQLVATMIVMDDRYYSRLWPRNKIRMSDKTEEFVKNKFPRKQGRAATIILYTIIYGFLDLSILQLSLCVRILIIILSRRLHLTQHLDHFEYRIARWRARHIPL